MVSRSRTVARSRFSLTVSGKSWAKASTSRSSKDSSPSWTANPTAQEVTLLLAEYTFRRHSSSHVLCAMTSPPWEIFTPSTPMGLALFSKPCSSIGILLPPGPPWGPFFTFIIPAPGGKVQSFPQVE